MSRFWLGKPIQSYEFCFEDGTIEIVKYHPWKTDGCTLLTGEPDTEHVMYSLDEISQASDSMERLLIAYIAFKRLGLNQGALVNGVCRALCIHE